MFNLGIVGYSTRKSGVTSVAMVDAFFKSILVVMDIGTRGSVLRLRYSAPVWSEQSPERSRVILDQAEQVHALRPSFLTFKNNSDSYALAREGGRIIDMADAVDAAINGDMELDREIKRAYSEDALDNGAEPLDALDE